MGFSDLTFSTILLMAAALFALTACGTPKGEAKYPTGADRGGTEDIYAEPESIFGDEGLRLFNKDDKKDDGDTGIGVNSYLWRASLDTVSFMPLASADPFGGVILTDWYAPAETPDKRMKLNVLILSKKLRSDGVQVKVFKQEKRGGTWQDINVPEETGRKIEDAILTRARQLRVAQRD